MNSFLYITQELENMFKFLIIQHTVFQGLKKIFKKIF